MTIVHPQKLVYLRKKMNLTATALAKKATIGRATITRIENEAARNRSAETIKRLTKALQCEPADLETPPEPTQQDTSLLGRSKVPVEMSDATQNALFLVARRYGESRETILELAPLLFDLVARESLNERKSRLAELDAHRRAISAMSSHFPHLSGRFTCDWEAQDFEIREEQSIAQADLRGEHVHAVETMNDAYYPADFDDEANNPFAAHLRSRLIAVAEDGREAATIEALPRYGSPYYEIGLPESREIAGNDDVIADAFIRGTVRIDAIPPNLRREGQMEERQAWAHQRLEDHSVRMAEMWDLLGIDLPDILEG